MSVPRYCAAINTVSFVRDGAEFLLMELELIEPSLYLRMNENAPASFAAAINDWLA